MRITGRVVWLKDTKATKSFIGVPDNTGRKPPIRAVYVEQNAIPSNEFTSGTIILELDEPAKIPTVEHGGQKVVNLNPE